jgi:hypothetical protein
VKHYEVDAAIGAPAAVVWDVLTDGDGFSRWDSGVERVEGTIADGSKIKVFSEVSPGRAFPVEVSLDPVSHTMTFTGEMPLGLFRGVRTYSLTPEDDGVRFRMREEFSGPLLSLIWRSMPDLEPSFRKFAAGLKSVSEAKV